MIQTLFSRLRNTRSGFIYSSANKFLAGVMCGIMCGGCQPTGRVWWASRVVLCVVASCVVLCVIGAVVVYAIVVDTVVSDAPALFVVFRGTQ